MFFLLQYIDKVVVVLYVQSCGRQSSSHSCSLDKVVDMPFVFNDSPWFNVQKTAGVPQLLRVAMVADVPAVQVVWCRFLRLWTPCDHTATSFSSTVEVPQTRSSQSLWTFCCATEKGSTSRRTGYDGDEWVFWRILRHFSRSSGYPGVERQFFEPSTMKSSSSSRAPRGAGVAGSFTPRLLGTGSLPIRLC